MHKALAITAAVLFVPSAAAQQMAKDPAADSVTVGVGGAYLPDYEGSDDYRFVPAPGVIGQVGGFAFQLLGNRASVDLIPNSPGPGIDLQAGPLAVLDFNRSSVKDIDDPRVRALGKRAAALELGGYVGVGQTGVVTSDYDKLSVSVSYRKGITGAHRGAIVQPSLSYLTPLSRKAAAGLFLSAEHASRDYARAYFDVDAAGAAASGLPQYTTRSGWKSITVGLLGGVALSGDLTHGWKLVGGVTYRSLVNDFRASPLVSLVGDRSQWMGVAGLAYTF